MENLSTILDFKNDSSLKLFAGDLFPVEKDSLRDAYLLKIAHALDFDAFLPGDADLSRFREIEKCDITLVLSNIRHRHRSDIFESVSLTKSGSRITIFGIWSWETYNILHEDLKTEWQYLDWKSTLSSLFASNEKSETIIVLTHGPESIADSVLMEFRQIDLVICANGGGNNLKPVSSGYVVNMDNRSGSAGIVEISFSSQSISRLANIGIENFSAIPILQNSPLPSPTIKSMVDEYYLEWYNGLLEKRRNFPHPDKVFLGNKFCGNCHQEEYKSWQSSSHAHAFDKIRGNENRCIPCHTTGFGYPTGFWDIETTPKLAGIGCEECHNVPKIPKITGKHKVEDISNSSCRCHVPPHDNDFDFNHNLSKIKHNQ